jgi:NAD(P)-dependent dehydrogenase (short-subunit alcohol dehydrogenase family)
VSVENFIVTGASRGLGAAICAQLSQLGHRVLATGRHQASLEARWQGDPNVSWLAADMNDPNAPDVIVQKALEIFGQFHGVVNNAGTIDPITPLASAQPDVWAQAIRVNLVTPGLLMRAAIPHLDKTAGKVVNISSGAAVKVVQGWSAYCASKAGLLHLTSAVALENPNISFFSLRPGVVDTDMQREIRESEGMTTQDLAKFQGLKESASLEPPEVPARAAVWLLLKGPKERSGEFIQYTDDEVVRGIETLFQLEPTGEIV